MSDAPDPPNCPPDCPPARPRDFRREVLSLLAAMAEATPIEPEQLLRAWFDHVYIPGQSYFDSLKGDAGPESAAVFLACFAPEEQEILERFHRFLELRLELLRKQPGGFAAAGSSPLWQSIARDARNALLLLKSAQRLEE